ncbi:MAG: cytochrome c class I [Niabella sp.]|nr:cytochrome c class I [Niabella sp.]
MKKIMLFSLIVIAACNSNAPAKPNSSDSMPANPAVAVAPAESSAVKTDAAASVAAPVDKDEKKYTNEKGDLITAVYHDSGDMGIVVLKKDGASIQLMKGEKKDGATVYTNGKITWKIKGGEALFEKDNVVSAYKASK